MELCKNKSGADEKQDVLLGTYMSVSRIYNSLYIRNNVPVSLENSAFLNKSDKYLFFHEVCSKINK